jgi:cytochrome bd ubiquinol oxidase subunit I
MTFNPLLLARLQFAANISFHILFPSITIGLCWILLYFRLRYTFSGDKVWEYAYAFWVKIFALNFAIGVVTGITMSFQFGTNWPGFMERAGNIAGPLLGYEVLTSFFLEASFLGVMLFGKNRVSNRVHVLSCALVALGTTASAFWILSLNSWMQTPAGYRIENGVFMVASWREAIFNPSFPYRLTHMLGASLLTAAFLVMGISAWRALRQVDGPATWQVMRTGAVMAAVLAPLQAFVGDRHGLNTIEHQPAKIAAMEAIWQTERGVPLTLLGFPDEEKKTTHYAVKVPNLASLIFVHRWDGELKGLNEFEGQSPPVAPVYWSFRVMVGVGVLMVVVAWWACWVLLRQPGGGRANRPWLLRVLSAMAFSGWVAVLAGWYVTEIGRQPWIVHGLLRTADVVAVHPSATLTGTLLGYVILYAFLLMSYISALRHLATKPAASMAILPHPKHFHENTAEGTR